VLVYSTVLYTSTKGAAEFIPSVASLSAVYILYHHP